LLDSLLQEILEATYYYCVCVTKLVGYLKENDR